MTSRLWVLSVLQWRRRDERRRPVWRQNASNEKLRRQRQGHDFTSDVTMTSP